LIRLWKHFKLSHKLSSLNWVLRPICNLCLSTRIDKLHQRWSKETTFSVNYYLFRHVEYCSFISGHAWSSCPPHIYGQSLWLLKIVPFLWSGKGFALLESNYFFLAFLGTALTLWTLMSGAPETGTHNLQTCRAV
jgi:hypothetical protein